MVIDRRKVLLFGAASALRLLLFVGFPSLPDLLTGRVEISTPVTSFKRRMCFTLTAGAAYADEFISYVVREGLFLYTHGLSPYDGGVFYQVQGSYSRWL